MEHRVEKVISLMMVNLRRRLTLGEMARTVHLTPEHLCRVFKAETGLPPTKYFKAMRMLRAQELLENTSLTIKEVGARVGANDTSHFVRDFESTFGLTPGRYRARHHSAREKTDEINNGQ